MVDAFVDFGDFTGMGDPADPERLLAGTLGALVGTCCGEVGGGGFSNLGCSSLGCSDKGAPLTSRFGVATGRPRTGVVSERLLDDE